MTLKLAIEKYEACPSCSTPGAIVWHGSGDADCDGTLPVTVDPDRWVKPKQTRNGDRLVIPDALSLGEIIRRDLASGEGTPEYRAWLLGRAS